MTVIKFSFVLGWLLSFSAIFAGFSVFPNLKELPALDVVILIYQLLLGISFIVYSRRIDAVNNKHFYRLLTTAWFGVVYVVIVTFDIGMRNYNEFGFIVMAFAVPTIFLIIGISLFSWMISKFKELLNSTNLTK